MTRLGRTRPLSELLQRNSLNQSIESNHASKHDRNTSHGTQSNSSRSLDQTLGHLFGTKASSSKKLKINDQKENLVQISKDNTQEKRASEVACFKDFIPNPLEEYNNALNNRFLQVQSSQHLHVNENSKSPPPMLRSSATSINNSMQNVDKNGCLDLSRDQMSNIVHFLENGNQQSSQSIIVQHLLHQALLICQGNKESINPYDLQGQARAKTSSILDFSEQVRGNGSRLPRNDQQSCQEPRMERSPSNLLSSPNEDFRNINLDMHGQARGIASQSPIHEYQFSSGAGLGINPSNLSSSQNEGFQNIDVSMHASENASHVNGLPYDPHSTTPSQNTLRQPIERIVTRSIARVECIVENRRFRGATKPSSCRPKKGKVHKCFFYRGSPVGKKAMKLTNTLGIYSRNGMDFPLHKEWGADHILGFESAMDSLMDDFQFFMWDGVSDIDKKINVEHPAANMDDVVHWCYTNMQKKVRSWRNHLKKRRFMHGHPNKENLTSPSARVTNDEWKKLLEYWRSPKKEKECSRNKASRGGPRPTHTTGAKSYSRCYQTMIENKEISSELEAYIKYHQDKNGDYPNEYTKQKCEDIANKCAQRQLENSKNHEAFIRVLDDVYGKHHGGCERGYGGGASRQRWKTARLDHVKMQPFVKQQTRIQELEAENIKLRELLRQENQAKTRNSHDLPQTSSSQNNIQEHCSSPLSSDHGN